MIQLEDTEGKFLSSVNGINILNLWRISHECKKGVILVTPFLVLWYNNIDPYKESFYFTYVRR